MKTNTMITAKIKKAIRVIVSMILASAATNVVMNLLDKLYWNTNYIDWLVDNINDYAVWTLITIIAVISFEFFYKKIGAMIYRITANLEMKIEELTIED